MVPGARLTFEHRPEAHADEIRALLARRKETQPIGEWSCGSTFTNPPGDHAARLIEAAGLKGFRIGGAAVSSKHANFFINEGEATARGHGAAHASRSGRPSSACTACGSSRKCA